VEIEYVSLLDWEGDKVRLFLLTTISPRYTPDRMQEREGIPEAARIHPEYAQEVPYGLSLDLNILIRVSFYSERIRRGVWHRSRPQDYSIVCPPSSVVAVKGLFNRRWSKK
jgi:hypothetical protein